MSEETLRVLINCAKKIFFKHIAIRRYKKEKGFWKEEEDLEYQIKHVVRVAITTNNSSFLEDFIRKYYKYDDRLPEFSDGSKNFKQWEETAKDLSFIRSQMEDAIKKSKNFLSANPPKILE